jgi:hypothetical protein
MTAKAKTGHRPASRKRLGVRDQVEKRLSASGPNVKGHDQEPQNKGRNQESVCPANNDAIGARSTSESDDGAVKQEQA